MNYPSIEQVITAIGKHTENLDVITFLSTIGISESDFNIIEDLKDRKEWADSDCKLQLDLKDVGSLTNIPYHDVGEGPWVLTDITFWSIVNSTTKQSYSGTLPYGLNFAMSKKEVQALISEPRVKDSERVDSWEINNHKLVVNYDPKNQKIRCIGLSILRPPLSS